MSPAEQNVNCPKCGFQQEERIDCAKCGVVISKYLAMGLPTAPPQNNPAPPFLDLSSTSFERTNHDPNGELVELRQSIKELQRQVADLEFGRAERARVRADLKTLSDRVRDDLAAFTGRITKLEETHREFAEGMELVSPEEFIQLEKDLKETYLRPMRVRVDAIEQCSRELATRVTAVAKSAESNGSPEAFAGFERRLTTLESTARIAEETARASNSTDILPRLERRLATLESTVRIAEETAKACSPTDILPRLEEAVSEIGRMRSSLEAVSMRYSEIGDLKKNHLVLSTTLDSVRTGLEAFKRQIADGLPRTVAELAREVAALRAESRQLWEQVRSAETPAGGK